jgi:hypothetical protein
MPDVGQSREEETWRWPEEVAESRPRGRFSSPHAGDPGRTHEGYLLIGLLFGLAFGLVIGLYWVTSQPVAGDVGIGSRNFGFVVLVYSGFIAAATALWWFADIRTPVLVAAGPLLAAFVIFPDFLFVAGPVLPAALGGSWAGLSGLRSHPLDRLASVAVPPVVGLLLGPESWLVLLPVALAAAIMPEIQGGPRHVPPD